MNFVGDIASDAQATDVNIRGRSYRLRELEERTHHDPAPHSTAVLPATLS